MYVVTYTGDKDGRAAIREHEFTVQEYGGKAPGGKMLRMKVSFSHERSNNLLHISTLNEAFSSS
jgi:hypothetical protein